ncbi:MULTISPECIES: hypothetical protein [Limnospira]|uniref:Uncharacterized protein n=2 Tax=Sirenicapillariaceae TaxID=2934961 RepID=A0ABU9EPC5_LIMFS|nr:hypothetical protein [Limnospira sp. PMC 1042.18]MDT9201283.1 hypothetical protein [Limnospira sp. PMC 1042.18]
MRASYSSNFKAIMNQKLVQSLVQIILSLSDEDRQYLEREIQKYSLAKQLENLEDKLKIFEAKYQMSSQEFYRQFQAGKLADSSDFFEWNTYYEMLNLSQVKISDKS